MECKRWTVDIMNMLGVEEEDMIKVYDGYGSYNILHFKNDSIYLESGDIANISLGNILLGLKRYEIIKPLLTLKEKKYLEDVIRPFKNRVDCIVKIGNPNGYYIRIDLDNDDITFPYFSKESEVYKKLEPTKKYTLKDLGLFEEE